MEGINSVNSDSNLTGPILPVLFILRQQCPDKPRQILLDCRPEETISAVRGRLAERIGCGLERIHVVFCGRELCDLMQLSFLALGPTTHLTVIISPPTLPSFVSSSDATQNEQAHDDGDFEDWVKIEYQLDEKSEDEGTMLQQQHITRPSGEQFSVFHVFCKNCCALECAKMRVYCRHCGSSGITFTHQEPQKWADVEDSNTIRVHCHSCNTERGVFFRFKCVKCDRVASALQHIRRNLVTDGCSATECVVCSSNSSSVGVRLPACMHFTCVECFVSYGKQLLSRMCLLWQPKVGYTIGCPVYGCSAFVTDVHTLYLLGIPAYQHYQQMAAQMYFSAQADNERQQCPWPKCGAAFFVDEMAGDGENGKMLLCPECSRLFCRRCCSTDAICKCVDEHQFRNDEYSSASLIRKTAKNCPKCMAPTERTGGCAHIHCTQCQMDWCFICLNSWSDSCQWDHWFD